MHPSAWAAITLRSGETSVTSLSFAETLQQCSFQDLVQTESRNYTKKYVIKKHVTMASLLRLVIICKYPQFKKLSRNHKLDFFVIIVYILYCG